ncbi:MAG: M56 family metallopeptidase [Syntrophomonadaceae bacterium]|nr:M56 family metallopeptidase [Syntrophomonadaceae bacterium]
MNGWFLDFLRTSVVVGAVALLLAAARPLWERRFGALWKKWLWCVLAMLLLGGAFLPATPNAVTVQVALPERPAAAPEAAEGNPMAVPAPTADTVIQPATPSPLPAPFDSGTVQAHSGAAPVTAARGQGLKVDSVHPALVLWAAGVAAFLLWQAVGGLLFRRQTRRWSAPPDHQGLEEQYRAACAEIGGRRFPCLLICPAIASPMLTGLFRPRLLLPRQDYGVGAAACILRHELTHFRRRDLWLKLLLLTANALHWFNPAVWLLRREAGRDIEYACDERLMRGASPAERGAYGQVLLAAARQGPRPALSTYFSGEARAMQQRLSGIMSGGDKRRGTVPAVAAALLAVGLLGLISCAPAESEGEGVAQALPESGYTVLPDELQRRGERYMEVGDTLLCWNYESDHNGNRCGNLYVVDPLNGAIQNHRHYAQAGIQQIKAVEDGGYAVMLPDRIEYYAAGADMRLRDVYELPAAALYSADARFCNYDYRRDTQQLVYANQEGLFLAAADGSDATMVLRHEDSLGAMGNDQRQQELEELALAESLPLSSLCFYTQPRLMGGGRMLVALIRLPMAQSNYVGVTVVDLENGKTTTFSDELFGLGGAMHYPDDNTVIAESGGYQKFVRFTLPDLTPTEFTASGYGEESSEYICLDADGRSIYRNREIRGAEGYSCTVSVSDFDHPRQETPLFTITKDKGIALCWATSRALICHFPKDEGTFEPGEDEWQFVIIPWPPVDANLSPPEGDLSFDFDRQVEDADPHQIP